MFNKKSETSAVDGKALLSRIIDLLEQTQREDIDRDNFKLGRLYDALVSIADEAFPAKFRQ